MSINQAQAKAGDAELQSHYLDWTAQSLTRLRDLQAKLPRKEQSADQTRDAMHAIAHDVKGMGGSFGYPLMSKIGASLCTYLRALPSGSYPAKEVVTAHLRAMDVVLTNQITDEGGEAGERLIAQLAAIQGPIPH